MAKIYFYYSAMNAGKSTVLLQASHNYHERGMRTLRFIPAIDTRAGPGRIRSRIGIAADAIVLESGDNLFTRVCTEHGANRVACVLVDEAQFLREEHVWQAGDVADELGVPVLCYGLRTDFQGKLFAGSAALLAIADELVELKTICHCGRKATMNVRLGADGQPVREGEQIQIGGNESYVAMCRRHFKDALGR
jgi:thymidine kinase